MLVTCNLASHFQFQHFRTDTSGQKEEGHLHHHPDVEPHQGPPHPASNWAVCHGGADMTMVFCYLVFPALLKRPYSSLSAIVLVDSGRIRTLPERRGLRTRARYNIGHIRGHTVMGEDTEVPRLPHCAKGRPARRMAAQQRQSCLLHAGLTKLVAQKGASGSVQLWSGSAIGTLLNWPRRVCLTLCVFQGNV